ncbi:hypothetical protein [Mammaliicoccus sciuri]|uniref:hypothetical protein n=1 Tax=Mammaliicoccus sciuri TaxID=1296 RepID=UPI001951D0A8|nr:hypothetical protein [Mammaliicoccus sciuri]
MNLRGHENRIKFLEEYDITPISHLKLLEGQKKEGVGGTLTDRYYCFSYSLKNDPKKVLGTFNCGYHIAEDLLKISNQDKLPLFNPFKVVNEDNQSLGNDDKDVSNRSKQEKEYNEVALQLTNAINLIIFCYEKNIKGTLAKIKNETDKYYYSKPYDYKIKSVNTIIEGLFDEPLIKKLNSITGNKQVKNYDFSLLTEVIERQNLVNYFE